MKKRDTEWTVQFNVPSVQGEELEYVREAVRNAHLCGSGPFTDKVCSLLAATLGTGTPLLVTSCTHALEMAAMLLEIGPEDEVVVPSFTFVSTANAFAVRGARLRFADVRPDTLNIDEQQLPGILSDRTKAIVPVHYAGVGCEMSAIMRVAAEHGVPVIEDNAHGLFGKHAGQYLGTFGAMATLSFHETKNFTCGEGGALLINDSRFVDRAEIIQDKGTDRRRFDRGQVDKYTWVDLGSSYVLSDMQAAYLYAQLELRDGIQHLRRLVWERYREGLSDWASIHNVELPVVPAECEQSYHMFYMLMPTSEHRDRLLDHLRQRGIRAVFHYQPLHISPMGRRFGGRAGDCPVTEDVAGRLLRLPFYTSLGEAEQGIVLDGVRSYPF